MFLLCSSLVKPNSNSFAMLLNASSNIPPGDQLTSTFLMLRPPWPIAERFFWDAKALCQRARIVGNQRPCFIPHITLLQIGGSLGRLDGGLLEAVDEALRMVRFPSFEIVLDEARSFETRKDCVPFVLEGAALTDVEALRLASLGALRVRDLKVPARRNFTPHMTISYSRRRSPRVDTSPFSWKASEFQLVESWAGLTKYVELGRWTLWDSEPPDPQHPWLTPPRDIRSRPGEMTLLT